MMREFCAQYPEYCFSQHKGYGTELHVLRLHAHGPCPIHRRSFEPVAQPLFAFARLQERDRMNKMNRMSETPEAPLPVMPHSVHSVNSV
jgi:hypothetical protein